MKNAILVAVGVFLLALGMWFGLRGGEAKWAGVDESVVERFAEEAGRPAQEPLINTDQGDVLLFVFLIAGVVGGFVGGYCFRDLFPAKPRRSGNATDV